MFFVSWVKQNKLATVLIIIVLFFFAKNLQGGTTPLSQFALSENGRSSNLAVSPSVGTSTMETTDLKSRSIGIVPPIQPDYAPQTDVANRLVISDSYLSLLVKDVVDTRGKIVKYAQDNGGYMVNANTNNPQDAPTATVIVRVPSKKLDDALIFYRGLGVKVVSENLVGTDVTDQYVDIDTRIKQLETTKSKLEEILDRATQISDITNLTQQILSYQNQIDSYKGQQDALSKNADLAKLTIYLSTDELALPYAPSETFRPAVIFKLAVRSLVSSLRDLATYAIWILVYAVVWVPLLLAYIFIRKWYLRRKSSASASSLKN